MGMDWVKVQWCQVPAIFSTNHVEDLKGQIFLRKHWVKVNPEELGTGIHFIENKEDYEEYVELSDGNLMPTIGFGTWELNSEQSLDSILWALQSGYKMLDTAQDHDNDHIIGAALEKWFLRHDREDVFISSKISYIDDMIDNNVREIVVDSLAELGIDYFDLYYIHGPFGDGEVLKQTWKELELLKDAGKIKSLGISNYNWVQLINLMEYARHKPVVIQNKYDIYTHGLITQDDNSLYKYIMDQKMAFTAYSVANSFPGLLNPIDDIHVGTIALELNISVQQVLYRWALQMGLNIIPRSKQGKHIVENIALKGFTLTPQHMQRLNGIMHMYSYIKPNYIHDYFMVHRHPMPEHNRSEKVEL